MRKPASAIAWRVAISQRGSYARARERPSGACEQQQAGDRGEDCASVETCPAPLEDRARTRACAFAAVELIDVTVDGTVAVLLAAVAAVVAGRTFAGAVVAVVTGVVVAVVVLARAWTRSRPGPPRAAPGQDRRGKG